MRDRPTWFVLCGVGTEIILTSGYEVTYTNVTLRSTEYVTTLTALFNALKPSGHVMYRQV
jgi:hypothetical protein